MAGSADEWQYKRIAAILKQLRELARERKDPGLSALLQRVRISIPDKSLVDENPNAYALLDKGANASWVVIEDQFLRQIAGLSELGALVAVGRWYGAAGQKLADDLVSEFCVGFQTRFRRAQRDHSPAAVYKFRFDDFVPRDDPRNAVQYMYFDKFTGIVFDNAVVWVLLHEVGHHALHHSGQLIASKSQQQEFDADHWAFARMKELGYSVFGVAQFMGARAITENCFEPLELLEDERTSTHPRWRARELVLYRDFDVGAAAEHDTRLVQFPVVIAPRPVLQTVTFPGPHSSEYVASIVQGGNIAAGAVEWRGRTATVYMREAKGGRIELVIPDATRVATTVKQRSYDSQNRFLGELEMDAVQMSERDGDWLEVSSMRISDIRARTKGDALLRAHVSKTGVSEAVVRDVLAVADEYQQTFRHMYMQFLKGQTSVENITQQITTWNARYEKQLILLLGEERYRAFSSSYSADIKSWMPPLTGADRWEEEILRKNIGRQ